MLTRLTVVSVLAATLVAGAGRSAAGQGSANSLDAAFTAFWRAADPKGAADATRAVLATTQDFETIYTRLKTGRPYAFGRVDDLTTPPAFFAPAATVSRARRNSRGLWHPYLVMVPPTYDPTRRYPVRVYLQGDTTRPASSAESGAGWPNYYALARDDAIVVFPGAWNGFAWWDFTQVEHMAAILDELKRSYNVDENRVFLLGSSDGGTGIYYHALLTATPWAGFLPFNADPSVLAEPQAGVDGQLHAANLANRPLFVVHGGRDQIFPADSVASWLRLFTSAGAQIEFDLKAAYGHETRWWAEETPAMDRFMAGHPRNPLPDTVVWETAHSDRFNRASWVVVDELGPAADETADAGPNEVVPAALGVGVGVWSELERRGIEVRLVQPGSPAAVAGLRDGDIIETIDGTQAPTFGTIERLLQGRRGETIALTLARAGQRLEVSLALPAAPPPAPQAAFPHPRPSGRVQVERRGNAVALRTRGVRRVTLLLSPERFDFSQPITIIANGSIAFDGPLTPNPAILLKWAARDNDRTMLFAQELEIRLP